MSEYVCKIERAANGWELEISDPTIAAQNKKMKGMWKDPKRDFIFKTVKEVTDFLAANLEKAAPMDEYECAFKEASKEDDD